MIFIVFVLFFVCLFVFVFCFLHIIDIYTQFYFYYSSFINEIIIFKKNNNNLVYALPVPAMHSYFFRKPTFNKYKKI